MVTKISSKFFIFIVFFFLFVFLPQNINAAWDFYGYVYDTDGNSLSDALVNITIWAMSGGPPLPVGSNSTTSNGSGWFNISVSENENWFYQPVIMHESPTTGAIDYVGQSLPHFPYNHFVNTTDINFYLKEAGTINITVVNRTGDRIGFRYQVKDTKLGFPIESEFMNEVNEAIVYVPKDRNYSIMVYPQQAMPVSFEWNNFTADSDYEIVSGLSTYNATTRNVQKTFNCTDRLIRLTGYVKNDSGDTVELNEFTVVPFILESGNMVYFGENSGMPHNMSSWSMLDMHVINESNAYINETGYQLLTSGFNYILTDIWADGGGEYNISVPLENVTVSFSGLVTNSTGTTYPNVSLTYDYFVRESDEYNLTSGFYNITLPGPAESVTYMLFATAREGSNYYGGYRNITMGYSDSGTELDFTIYPLMSTDWASQNSNISLMNPTSPGYVNISSAKQQFNLINVSNATLSNVNAHIEIKVDYSNYGGTEFTFMMDTSSGSASFYLPLLNVTGIKEINIFSQSYAPRRVGTKTVTQILNNNNITLTIFNPEGIDGDDFSEDIQIAMYKSNSTCNVPNPDDSCIVLDSTNVDDLNPLSVVMGGGKLNFRMGLISSGIIVQYVNVDLIASGPPDAMFDSEATTSTSNGFDSAMRFGSTGPTIYDYVLISMPYTPGSSSQTGLDENSDVNISIPLFYDENWNIIWNSSENGTSGNSLGANNTHYLKHFSEWDVLMKQNNCTKNQSELNATNPCYIDTANNRIWLRLPHFSGTQPRIIGDLITADSNGGGSSGGGGSGIVTTIQIPKKIESWLLITPGAAAIMKNFSSEIGIKEITITVNNPAQNVTITITKHTDKPAEVSVEKQGKVYQYLEINAENLRTNLDNAIVEFRVQKSWTINNSFHGNEIAIFKFNENSEMWDELETIYFEEDSTYYYYHVDLEDFSYFAIGEKESVSILETEEIPYEEPEENLFEDEEKTKSFLLWWGILIGAVVVVLTVTLILLKKNRLFPFKRY